MDKLAKQAADLSARIKVVKTAEKAVGSLARSYGASHPEFVQSTSLSIRRQMYEGIGQILQLQPEQIKQRRPMY